MRRSLAGNIRRYHWFQFSSSLFGWLPVFFLYFSQFVSLSEVIQLGAIYYFSVCLCEVPSGYFSDRVGRRLTLLLAGISFLLSYCIFLQAEGFIDLAIGQFLLALGIAMMSGTDTALLYDSLLSSNLQQHYADYEARGQKYSLGASATASLAGGILGLVDLRLAYVMSLVGAVWMVWLTWSFVEPDRHASGQQNTQTMIVTIRQCFGYLADKVLAWLFAAMVLMYSLEHIAFEFYQPYIKLLDIDWLASNGSSMTTLISGIVIAISMFGGALGAAYSVRLYHHFGVKSLLFAAFAIQLLIVAGLSIFLGSLMLCMVIFRNFPMAIIHAPVNATIAPRIGSHLRATYLSIQSLSARLAFSALLFVLSLSIDPAQQIDWSSLSKVLREALAFGVIGTLGVILLAPALPKRNK